MRKFLIVFITFYSFDALSAIAEVQALGFGQFAIGDNNSVSTLTVPYVGSRYKATNRLYPISHGQAGHYQLTAYPAFTPLIITITDFDLSIGMSEPLEVRDFTYDSVMTDANGDALLKVGATLKTTGSSTTYGDGSYSGNINITINW